MSAWMLLVVVGCGPSTPPVINPSLNIKGETFGYRQWVSAQVEPDVVVIGIHGFCGASADYSNLGEDLMRHQPQTALYAYELRGQGSDPIVARRGDIGHPTEWYWDLLTFTSLVRERHPQAKIVWMGESMGSLIAAHAWCEAPDGEAPCEGLILSSPIVRFRDDVPAWTPALVELAATALPTARISLEMLMAGEDVEVTQGSSHLQQAEKNPYHIKAHTLRLIAALSRLIGAMDDCASQLRVPLLVLHGGRDFFNNDSDLRGFVAGVARGTPVRYLNYPQAYHLLMHDEQRDRVFRDLRGWLDGLREGRF